MIHYTFIDFILLTPFANLLFRMLGARLGRNVQFNSKDVYDASLLEIGDNTVVGGGRDHRLSPRREGASEAQEGHYRAGT